MPLASVFINYNFAESCILDFCIGDGLGWTININRMEFACMVTLQVDGLPRGCRYQSAVLCKGQSGTPEHRAISETNHAWSCWENAVAVDHNAGGILNGEPIKSTGRSLIVVGVSGMT